MCLIDNCALVRQASRGLFCFSYSSLSIKTCRRRRHKLLPSVAGRRGKKRGGCTGQCNCFAPPTCAHVVAVEVATPEPPPNTQTAHAHTGRAHASRRRRCCSAFANSLAARAARRQLSSSMRAMLRAATDASSQSHPDGQASGGAAASKKARKKQQFANELFGASSQSLVQNSLTVCRVAPRNKSQYNCQTRHKRQ